MSKYEIYYDKDADQYILDNTICYKIVCNERVPNDIPDQEILILDKTYKRIIYISFYTSCNLKNKIALKILCEFKSICGYNQYEDKEKPSLYALFVIDKPDKPVDQVSYYDYFDDIRLIINTVKDELNNIFKEFLKIEIPDNIYEDGIFDVMDYIEKYNYKTYWNDYLRDPE